MSSIGCIPEKQRVKGRRQSLGSYLPGPEGNDEASPLLSRRSSHVKRYDDRDMNPRKLSEKRSQDAKLNLDWLLEDDNSSSGQSRLSHQSRKSLDLEIHEEKTPDSRRKSTPKQNFDDEYCLARGYADLPDEPLPPLIKSHPCSGMWLEFLGNKLLILFLGLMIVFLQNLFMYPSIFSIFHFSIDREFGLFLYCLITTFVVPLRLAWIIYICDVSLLFDLPSLSH